MAIERGILQPAPPGLLSLLQLKQRGQNPDALGDTVVPVIDLTHWYGLDSVEAVDGMGTFPSNVAYVGAVGVTSGAMQLTPEGEVWWVHEFSAAWLYDEATTTSIYANNLAPCMFRRELGPLVGREILIGEPLQNYSSADNPLSGVLTESGSSINTTSLRNFWALPGSTFGINQTFFGAPGSDPLLLFTSALITRLKI